MRITWLLFLLRFHSEVKLGLSRKTFNNRPLYVRVPYVGFCEVDSGDVSGNFTIDYVGPKVIVSGIADIHRQMDKAESATVTIRQCTSPALEKNCETFQTWRFGQEACALAERKHVLWEKVFYAFHPQMKCPVLQRVYTATNATVDTADLINVFGAALLEKHFWRVRLDVLDYKLFAGVCFGAYFIRGKH